MIIKSVSSFWTEGGMDWFTDYLHFSLALLAICGPQSAIPIFVNLTEGMGTREKSGIARQAGITVACVLLSSAFSAARFWIFSASA